MKKEWSKIRLPGYMKARDNDIFYCEYTESWKCERKNKDPAKEYNLAICAVELDVLKKYYDIKYTIKSRFW
jgi:hypothetical protein